MKRTVEFTVKYKFFIIYSVVTSTAAILLTIFGD